MDNSSPATNLRSKTRRAAAEDAYRKETTSSTTSSTPSSTMAASSTSSPTRRNPPFLPTPIEAAVVAVFPALLVFGTLFSVLSPQVRRAEFDPISQAHVQDPAVTPGYFARKDNIFNTLFVKRGWFWTSVAFACFVQQHPAMRSSARHTRAAIRWGLVTACWYLVTQWCFGPAIIDRSFRWTGGKCESVMMERAAEAEGGTKEPGDLAALASAVACKAAGGAWRGGHDVSGHVFLLVLASGFLLQEVGWVAARYSGWRDNRTVVMHDGAVKAAGVEAEDDPRVRHILQEDSLGLGGKIALLVVGLSCWMLLMTAIYFHTWFEKVTGLLTAFTALSIVYIIPRFTPGLRSLVGLPGI